MVLKDRTVLATLMAIRRVSYRELAEAVGWKSHGHVGNLLHNPKKQTVTPASAIRMANFFGVEVEDLFMPRATTNRGPHDNARRAA